MERTFVRTLPNCKVVDLSWNRLHGLENPELVDKPLRELLGLSQIAYVNVTYNALASVDRKDLFTKLAADGATVCGGITPPLARLIWIPEEWLTVGNWKKIVPSDAVAALVTDTHSRYYTTDRRALYNLSPSR